MKTRSVWKIPVGVALTILPLAGGCLQETGSTPPTSEGALTTSQAVVAPATAESGPAPVTPVAVASDPTPATAATNPPPDVDLENAPVKPLMQEAAAPAAVRTSAPVSEIVRMANAGVDEGVMMAYVTNSASMFNLGADQIIYLNDVGVPGAVVTAMIHRDEEIKAAWAASNAQPPVYAASTNQAPAQPAPEQMAPQATQPASGGGVVYQAPAVDPSYSVFYDSLSPYGTWVDLSGYGPVWQPTVVVVNPGWRPYYDCGHWVYSDCGWYWYSDYSWGWAPFHYGRWFRHHRMGWCWAPDRIWGPSWVSWRYTDAYCGWAPLPPAACYRPGFGFSYYGGSMAFNFGWIGSDSYAFIGWSHFRQPRYDHGWMLPPQRVHNIYNNTVVVNNFVTQNNVVINRGIPTHTVASATRSEVRTVSLRTTTRSDALAGRGERFDASRRTLTVYRPQVPQPTRNEVVTSLATTRTEPRAAVNRGAGASGTSHVISPKAQPESARQVSGPVGRSEPRPNVTPATGTRSASASSAIAEPSAGWTPRPVSAPASTWSKPQPAPTITPRSQPTPSASQFSRSNPRQSTPANPLIMRGSSQAATAPSAANSAVGTARQNNLSRQYIAEQPPASQNYAPRPVQSQSIQRPVFTPATPPATAPQSTWAPTAPMNRQQAIPSRPTYSAPSYSAPPARSYSPPAQPSYTPRVAPAPAPAPAAPRSQGFESRGNPSNQGGRGNGRNQP